MLSIVYDSKAVSHEILVGSLDTKGAIIYQIFGESLKWTFICVNTTPAGRLTCTLIIPLRAPVERHRAQNQLK